MRAKDILKIKGNILYTTTPKSDLKGVVKNMSELNIGSFVVIEDKKLVGIVTFQEVIKLISNQEKPDLNILVEQIMIKNPRYGSPEMPIDDIRSVMVKEHIRYFPILSDGFLVGVLSFHDVAKAMLEFQSFENEQLLNYINK